MIPRAMEMVFREAAYLRERGWEYKMGGQYVEIYNEQVSLNISCRLKSPRLPGALTLV